MNKLICGIIFVIGLFSFNSYADEEIIFLNKGQVAPFSGSLLSVEGMTKILQEKEYLKKECDLNLKYELQKLKEKSLYDIGNLKIELDITNKKYVEINKIKDDEIKKMNDLIIKEGNKSNYKEWWYIGGIITGITMSVGTIYAINQISK